MITETRWLLVLVSLAATFLGTRSFVVNPRFVHSPRRILVQRSLTRLLAIRKPSIAIVGSGAVGGYYGARLWESGYEVNFYMRGDHYDISKANGLNVTSVHGDIFIPPEKLQAFNSTKDIGTVDWVIVAIKSTALELIPELIAPLLNPGHTRVLAIMNGLIEDDLIHLLKKHYGESNEDEGRIECCGALYGGMALVCCNRLGPGRIDHSYAGLLSSGVAAHSPNQPMEQNRKAFEDLWGPVQIDTVFEPSLLGGRWRKNCWNLPFNGISVAMAGITVDKIMTDPGLRQLAHHVMDETIAAANADLKKHGFDESFYLGEADKKKMFDLSDGMGAYRTSTMIDFVERRPMEVKYLFRKPVEKAQSLGVPVPHLETLVLQIEALQKFHNLY
jgi:2-dehydropantoate 2-reductase